MKKYSKFLSLSLLLAFCLSLPAFANPWAVSDSTGLPGDHFSLEGALELFKKAQSPEDFEKLLNTEDSEVNNLDLNEDQKTDYIRVIDTQEGDVHAIILQVAVSAAESQDIAVIEIEKQGDEEAILQIVGDENIYGEQIIAEPFEEEAKGGGKGGPNAEIATTRIIVNVWLWPSVRFMYRPGYRVWVSPWRWAYYPSWYRPWRPRPWRWYSGRTVVWRSHCHVVRTHRVVRAHRVYAPRRTSSKVVRTRTTTRVAARKTTTTKVVKTPNGNVVAGRKTTTKAVGKSKDGNVVAGKKTTTKAVGKSKDGNVAAGKKTTTKAVGKSKDGRVKAGKKTTTKAAGKSKSGRVKAGKKTTTKAAGKSKSGRVKAGKKTTTKKATRGKKGRAAASKKTKTTKVRRRGN